MDPLIKSQLLYQLSYAPGLPRRKTAGRAWLSKGGPVSPAKTVLRSFPHRRKNSDSAIIALDPRFRGGERREMRARCKSYSAHSRESGTPGHKFRCRRMGPRFRGGERREMRARCKSYSAHSRESRNPGHKFRCRRMGPRFRGDERRKEKEKPPVPRRRLPLDGGARSGRPRWPASASCCDDA